MAVQNRSHPSFGTKSQRWNFFALSYKGGQDYVDEHLIQDPKESEENFKNRKDHAYRSNNCKRVVNLINSYIFKETATRKTENASLRQFIDDSDAQGRDIGKFMNKASIWASIFGRIYIVIDKKVSGLEGSYANVVNNIPYCYIVYPTNVRDVGFDDFGNITWCLIEESYREGAETFDTAKDKLSKRFRLWEIGKWTLYNESGEIIETGVTNLDVCPVVALDCEEDEDAYDGQSLIADIAYLDKSIFNNWSGLNSLVKAQTFSQLVFPIESLPTDSDKINQQILTISKNNILLYSGTASHPPTYISPDAKQAEFILRMIVQQTKELFSTFGLEGEVATETKVASGIAKAYEFNKLNKLLSRISSNLERAEKSIFKIVLKWQESNKQLRDEITIAYPTSFDVRTLADEIIMIQELLLLNIGKTFNEEVLSNLIDKALPNISDDKREIIRNEMARILDTNEFSLEQSVATQVSQPKPSIVGTRSSAGGSLVLEPEPSGIKTKQANQPKDPPKQGQAQAVKNQAGVKKQRNY